MSRKLLNRRITIHGSENRRGTTVRKSKSLEIKRQKKKDDDDENMALLFCTKISIQKEAMGKSITKLPKRKPIKPSPLRYSFTALEEVDKNLVPKKAPIELKILNYQQITQTKLQNCSNLWKRTLLLQFLKQLMTPKRRNSIDGSNLNIKIVEFKDYSKKERPNKITNYTINTISLIKQSQELEKNVQNNLVSIEYHHRVDVFDNSCANDYIRERLMIFQTCIK